MTFEIPGACTLPTVERPIRLAEFDELLTVAVRSAERDSSTHLTLLLHRDEELEAVARDLAAREAECCSFFELTVTANRDDIVLGIGVPPQHAPILDSLQARRGAMA